MSFSSIQSYKPYVRFFAQNMAFKQILPYFLPKYIIFA